VHLTNYHCLLKDFALGKDDDWRVRNRALTAAGDICGAVIPCCLLADSDQGIDYVWNEPATGRALALEGQATQPGRPPSQAGR